MVKVVEFMSGLIDAVAEYQNSARSIGYSYRYYIDNQYSNENIKQLRIEGVAPTDENIISGAYPLSVEYYGVIRAGEEDGPRRAVPRLDCERRGAGMCQAGGIYSS